MHKAINFDLDTKKYEIITQKSAPANKLLQQTLAK